MCLKNVFGAYFIDFIFNKNEDVQISTVFEYFTCQLQNKKYLIAVYKQTFVMLRIPFQTVCCILHECLTYGCKVMVP